MQPNASSNSPNAALRYDVAVIGGALSGASAALLLARKAPNLRVLVLEKTPRFTRRVGEATVEVSSYFLGRVLGLTRYLNESHLVKQGLRFWFADPRNETAGLDEASEIGGRYFARVPAYQVDRATLDEEILRQAGLAGVEIWRPALVTRVQLKSGGTQELTVKKDGETHEVEARWVVDASGVAALLSRQLGWWRPNAAHPTASAWARWKGVKDWDGLELAEKFPGWAGCIYGARGTATNHFMGDGWWAWCIPLKGGDVSVGVVFDQRLVEWPEGGSMGERIKEFLLRHPVAREILREAQWEEGDVHWRKNLAYFSTAYAEDGWVLVGDAGAFLDPFYSPGMDWVSFGVMTAVELILAQTRGQDVRERVARLNRDFARSYARWFESIYQNKYEYMGDYELMRLAFLMDLGLYYAGVASQPFKYGAVSFSNPVFSNKESVPAFHLMRTYNRRFARIAQERRRRGKLGAQNRGRRFLFKGYTFTASAALPLLGAFASWMILELKEGWRSWRSRRASESALPRLLPAVEKTLDQR